MWEDQFFCQQAVTIVGKNTNSIIFLLPAFCQEEGGISKQLTTLTLRVEK